VQNTIIRGRAWVYGDDVNTDMISPAKYMDQDYETIGKHAMESIEPGFAEKVARGDIVVAGSNFGSGSSRETAQIALKYAGISLVIAKSFARIFYRNSINVCLPVLELLFTDEIAKGDELEVDLMSGTITNISKNKSYKVNRLPELYFEIAGFGGFKEYIKHKIT
jgi:3-isopropylmalate dehydratase small subunit